MDWCGGREMPSGNWDYDMCSATPFCKVHDGSADWDVWSRAYVEVFGSSDEDMALMMEDWAVYSGKEE